MPFPVSVSEPVLASGSWRRYYRAISRFNSLRFQPDIPSAAAVAVTSRDRLIILTADGEQFADDASQ